MYDGLGDNAADATLQRIVSSDGIDWYVEQRGVGDDIVLIPSGEGDCASFATVAADLATNFRVTTFDTPGFSRSKVSRPEDVSVIALAGQIAGLIESLGIHEAVFYGCSSGGLAVLDLLAAHPRLVRRAVIHEAALPDKDGRDVPMMKMLNLDDAGIIAACQRLFQDFFNENAEAWQALPQDVHDRLAINYPVWIRRYVATIGSHPEIQAASIAGKPITWTIGGLFEVRVFFSNVQLAHRAGIEIGMLPCRHFPQVSIPVELAAHIRAAARI